MKVAVDGEYSGRKQTDVMMMYCSMECSCLILLSAYLFAHRSFADNADTLKSNCQLLPERNSEVSLGEPLET